MKTIYPNILKTGDKIAVVAISEDMSALPGPLVQKAVRELETYGLTASLPGSGPSNSIGERLTALHAAFADPEVKAVLIGLGGVSAVEILPYIDFHLIRENPKIICGFSDATIILQAIYAKTGLTTWYGPMLFSFAANADKNYTREAFQQALFSRFSFGIKPASGWSNYDELDNRRKNHGFHVLRAGHGHGVLVGGHVPSMNLLQGTSYLPSLREAVLFIEICGRYGKDTAGKFMQYLNGLLLQQDADQLQGLLIGRFYHQADVSYDNLHEMLLSHPLLQHIPIIANVDFGHTTPMATLPIGGRVIISQDTITVEAR